MTPPPARNLLAQHPDMVVTEPHRFPVRDVFSTCFTNFCQPNRLKTCVLRGQIRLNSGAIQRKMRRITNVYRRFMSLALAEWPKLSDVEIGRICAVGKTLVGDVRRESQPVEKTGSETRIGRDGKERKISACRGARRARHSVQRW